MVRIVKAGAILYLLPRFDGDKGHNHFAEPDTIEIKPGWRPKDYKDIKNRLWLNYGIIDEDVDHVFDACLGALGEVK